MSDREASNYSIQPRYPYPQSPPMGALAAADSYAPTDWPAGPAELPDIGAPLLSPGPQVSAGQPWANRLADALTTPRQDAGDDTVLYKTASPRVNFTQGDINRGMDLALSFSGGGLATRDPALWHGVSTIKLPKPVAEMESVVRPVSQAAETVISPAKLQNSMLMPLLGDRSAAGAELARVNGYPFENAVPLQGGHGYMANNPEMAWAAGKSIAPGIGSVARMGAESGLPVHGVYTAMGERSVDFSHMVSDALSEMVKHTKVTPEGAAAFNSTMKSIAPDFPGVGASNLAQYLRDAPGEVRNTFAKTMDTSKMQAQGFPSVAEARVAVTDPRLLHEPTGAAGLSIARMDPTGRLGPSGHTTYDTGIAGDYIGGLAASVPKEIMFPDIVGPLSKHADAVAMARAAEGKSAFRPTEDYLMSRVPKGLPRLQMADQKWVDQVSKHLMSKGFKVGGLAGAGAMGSLAAQDNYQPQ